MAAARSRSNGCMWAMRKKMMVMMVGMMGMMAAAAAEEDEHNIGRRPCSYPAVFTLGDSLSDTGNCLYSGNVLVCGRTDEFPYGETFPGRPAKRFSDGRLIVPDFLATYLGLPPLRAYLEVGANLSAGVNYAVAGATAVDVVTLAATYGIANSFTPLSLDVQLSWHTSLKATIDSLASLGLTAPGRPSPASFKTGLYVLEIGGNDYINALRSGLSPASINTTLLPQVIAKIVNATHVLYKLGARNFLFVSITPLGCSPSILAASGSMNGGFDLDGDGCLVDVNRLSEDHGRRLHAEAIKFRAAYPAATFSFLDYYNAYTYILRNKAAFGFTNTLGTCCGSGNPNGNVLLFCNSVITRLNPSAYLCSNPNEYLNWDGIHFTDAFNAQVANQTIRTGTFLDPPHALLTGYCKLNVHHGGAQYP